MAKERMTGAMAVRKALEAEGVDWIFGVPGGAILPFYDALFDSNLAMDSSCERRKPSSSTPFMRQ